MALSALFVEVTGLVQGVGFRPFVHRTAITLDLRGHVRNTANGVEIEVEGDAETLAEFMIVLRRDAPAAARISTIRAFERPFRDVSGFHIADSDGEGARAPGLVPDLAVCDACLAEVRSAADRRHDYHLASCSECGPRWTMVERLPYDRARTSMRDFPLCSACAAEYESPNDRRFHAQSTSCGACGPRYRVRGSDAPVLATAIAAIERGEAVAIKGLGGFHLFCDAGSDAAVMRVRAAKQRDHKPLAVMVRDLAAAEAIATIDAVARTLLRSPACPIVLLRPRPEHGLAPAVAADVPRIGVMLPSTALHHALVAALDRPLVVTSANHGDEPIPIDDDGIADDEAIVIVHDRRIVVHADDSLAQIVDGAPMLLRRARGFVPAPLRLPRPLPCPTLAVGGHLKAACAIGVGAQAVIGPHVGDLDRLATRERWAETIAHLEAIVGARVGALVCDLHPDYASTAWARTQARARAIPLLAVQHHHAHLAAVLAEHGIDALAIGICLDGTGLGTDRAPWGGELLVGDCSTFRRAGHLGLVAQPGGDAAARAPWRMAVAHLLAAGCELDVVAARVGGERVADVRAMIERSNPPLTSSAGRLFDAVAAVLGYGEARFEGSAAMWLEALAEQSDDERAGYRWIVDDDVVLGHAPMWRALLADVADAVPRATIARRFHRGLAEALADACTRLRTASNVVALGGGVFQNALFTAFIATALRARGFTVLRGEAVPPNDGGLAYGQLAVAASVSR